MNFFVADPQWGQYIIGYFFLGGIAAGSYFIAILIEWFGSEEDRPLTRIAYLITFPLIVICGLLLTIDLYRPERFWHMLLKSEVTEQAFAHGFPFTAGDWRLTRRHSNIGRRFRPAPGGYHYSAPARSFRFWERFFPSVGRAAG